MKRQYVNKVKLPDSPGVYIFRDHQNRPIYIGRATSLRDRVRSYFSPQIIDSRGPRIVDMVTKAHSLKYEKLDSVLEAVLRESELIKRYQPFYNVDERDDKSDQYVVITDELWPRVYLARARDFLVSYEIKGKRVVPKDGEGMPITRAFGPYPQGGLIKEALKILRKMFPYKDKKSLDPRHDRFYQALGRSPDQAETAAHEAYMKTIDHLILFFEGRKRALRSSVKKEMLARAADRKFEEAQKYKHLLYALDHINDIALIKKEGSGALSQSQSGFRIEAYDIAHLSGTNVVGVMVASVDGEFSKNEYRKFKLRVQANNDIAGLTEVLLRRLNHTEWRYPDLVVVDGNEAHRATAERMLKSRRSDIPVVAVTKDERHKASKLIGDAASIRSRSEEIIALNAEAHRFAIAFHRKRRSRLV